MVYCFPVGFTLFRLLFITCLAAAWPNYSLAQAGSLDNSFGSDGKVVTSLGNFNDKGHSIAIQPNQKIVLGGSSQSSFTSSDFALMRYHNNGMPDMAFGTAGKVITPIEDRSEGKVVLIQNDGKIVLGGNSKWHLNIVRYQSDGTLDSDFGSGGLVITDIEGYYGEQCRSAAIQSDGKIVLGGYAQHNSNDNSYFLLVRYLENGSVDSTFGTNGQIIGSPGKGRSISIQDDDKILLGGSSDWAFALERYHPDGTLDNAFGSGGQVITPLGISCEGHSVLIQPDEKILFAGYAKNNSGTSQFAVVRYHNNGTLDSTFGNGGKVITPLGDAGEAHSLCLQSDGKILLAGEAKEGSNLSHFALARYHSDGTPDNTFGTTGNVITPIGTSYSLSNSSDLQSDGKIVLGGYAFNGATIDIALARYKYADSVDLEEVSRKQRKSRVWPNPFNISTTIQLSPPPHNARLMIYNASGQVVRREENVSGSEIQIRRNELADGLYFLQLLEKNAVITETTLIIGPH